MSIILKKILFIFIIDCFAFIATSYPAKSNIKDTTIKNNQYGKIISSGKFECKMKNSKFLSKNAIKKITVCPITYSKNDTLSFYSIKNIFRYYYKIRNLIYIICFIFLLFIWARVYWQKFPEWKMFFYVVIILFFTTLGNALVNWYILYDDIYFYHCKKTDIIWQLCKRGKGAFNALEKNLIMLDSNGNVLNKNFISDRFKNRYKVNMFY